MPLSTADLRQFLTDYFSDDEFTTLCFDFFTEVHNSFASGMSKGQKIQLLLEHVQRREQLPDLLQVLQQQRPVQYAKRFGQAEATPVTQPPPASPAPKPKADAAPAQPASNVSGGVNLEGQQVSIGNDVVGRDKITYNVTPPADPEQLRRKVTPVANVQTWGGVEFVRIPAGKFLMGSKKADRMTPLHSVEIPYDYWMARYPLTNEQFAQFVQEAAYKFSLEQNWQKKADHPVVNVSWYDAVEYCKWLHTVIAKDIQAINAQVLLPTDAEWEKAARGEYGNEWPWGNKFDKNKCNSSEGGKKGTTPVGAYSPQGDSPYGVADMAGNVWEWCRSYSLSYPNKPDKGHEAESDTGVTVRMLRGGAFRDNRERVRCFAIWTSPYPLSRLFVDAGFRVVVSPGLG